MRRRIPCIVATAVLVQTVVVPFAAAQSEPAPAVELAAGYQSGLFDPYESGAWPPPAWFGSASFKRTGRLAVEVEFTGLRTRVTDVARFFHPDFPDAGDGRKERKNQLYTLTSGVRYAWRGSRLSPFVRVLGGLFSSRARTDYVWPPEAAQVNANCGVYLVKPDGQEQLLASCKYKQFPDSRDWGATLGLIVQPGAGVDLRVADRLALRFAADLPYLFRRDGALARARITAGAVIGFGK